MVVKGNSNMALHLTGHRKISATHAEFLDSYILVKEGVVNSKGKIGEGVSEPLMQLVEKE
jgi:hypothetical protein